MIAVATISLLLLTFAYYLYFLSTVLTGLRSVNTPGSEAKPFVSVIVAARNEAGTITGCLQSLSNQSYDASQYEIILVDDHSDDRTLALAEGFKATIEKPRIVTLSLEDNLNHYGKPAAIAHGIASCQGEFVLCTDVDCVVQPEWISSMVRCFEPDIVFVAGPVAEISGNTLRSRLQSLEFLGLIATGAGLIGSGKPIICNGANIGYRRSAFEAVSGYGQDATSCDDETLMQRMLVRKTGKVIFNFDPSALVTTPTPDTFSAFWQQRTRWAAKRGHYESNSIFARLIMLFAFFLVAFISSIVALTVSALWIPLATVIMVKAVIEWVVLQTGAQLFRQRVRGADFLIAELFHVPYIVLATVIGQFGSKSWKNRKLEQ